MLQLNIRQEGEQRDRNGDEHPQCADEEGVEPFCGAGQPSVGERSTKELTFDHPRQLLVTSCVHPLGPCTRPPKKIDGSYGCNELLQRCLSSVSRSRALSAELKAPLPEFVVEGHGGNEYCEAHERAPAHQAVQEAEREKDLERGAVDEVRVAALFAMEVSDSDGSAGSADLKAHHA